MGALSRLHAHCSGEWFIEQTKFRGFLASDPTNGPVRLAPPAAMAQRFDLMTAPDSRVPAATALVGALLGLLFSSYSSLDYAEHLDRRIHDMHCSIVPGVGVTDKADACRAAMYSSYSSVLRDSMWGGIPISLFAVGAFTFFAAFAVYLLLARARASRSQVLFFALTGMTPLLVSIVMFIISVTKLGGFCLTCVGTYIGSAMLAAGSGMGLMALGSKQSPDGSEVRPQGNLALAGVWVLVLGVVTLLPVGVYAASVPDHRPFLGQCGELKKLDDPQNMLVRFRGARAVQPALFVEDPLCPTCKAFHERLQGEAVLDRFDVTVTLFPLDSSCNWMLTEPLHPGACTVSKAVLCGKERALQVLEWAFDNQQRLRDAGKRGEPALRGEISAQWGQGMLDCIDSRETKTRLNKHLHFAAENGIPVSTPQIYLGKRRLCDEDSDLGLRYTLKQLAPEVVR